MAVAAITKQQQQQQQQKRQQQQQSGNEVTKLEFSCNNIINTTASSSIRNLKHECKEKFLCYGL